MRKQPPVFVCVCVCVCVCACVYVHVCIREREREGEADRDPERKVWTWGIDRTWTDASVCLHSVLAIKQKSWHRLQKVTFPIGLVGAKGLPAEKDTGESERNSQVSTFWYRKASNELPPAKTSQSVASVNKSKRKAFHRQMWTRKERVETHTADLCTSGALLMGSLGAY